MLQACRLPHCAAGTTPSQSPGVLLGVERYARYDWNTESAERRYTGGPGQKGAMTSGDGRVMG